MRIQRVANSALLFGGYVFHAHDKIKRILHMDRPFFRGVNRFGFAGACHFFMRLQLFGKRGYADFTLSCGWNKAFRNGF